MLTRTTVLADALALIALLAFALLFTDRGAFAWTLNRPGSGGGSEIPKG